MKEIDLENNILIPDGNPANANAQEISEEERIRRKEDYVLEYRSEANAESFVNNEAREHNNIQKSTRQAIKEVMGEEVYDDVDEMFSGDRKDRKVKIHHSTGNKWLRSGADVIQLDFAGSGYETNWKEHKEHYGEIDRDELSPKEIQKEYGTKVKKEDGTSLGNIYLRRREYTDSQGNTFEKKRYDIGGACPSTRGAINLGKNSIESLKSTTRDLTADFLKTHLDRWLAGTETPHDIHISLTGWSRGAVAAGQAAKKINAWLEAYKQKNQDIEKYLKHIKLDMVLRDPVPGFITNWHLSSCNLRNIPNLNTTVICTMAQEHFDMFFPLQQVKGAKKLILSVGEHKLDLEDVDKSQEEEAADGKQHQAGYFDAETGEVFRGSGLSELPDGVYISDDKRNLIRITSYSQIGKLMSSVYGKTSPQSSRATNIHKMVRDWFVENSLETGFADEKTRIAETANNTTTQERILFSPNKRLEPVKRVIRELRELMRTNPSKEDIVKKNEAVIKACRAYMKKTRIPAAGDSAYRVNLVSDMLSFTMRENNHLKKELNKERGIDVPHPLEDQMRAFREKLENREGYLQRKLDKEKSRLEKETEIRNYINQTASICRNHLAALDRTTGIIMNSEEYDDYHKILTYGSRLGDHTSIDQFSYLLKKMTKVASEYVQEHKGIVGPLTSDGKTRFRSAKLILNYAKSMGMEVEKKSMYLGEKERPIGNQVARRKAIVKELKAKVPAPGSNRQAKEATKAMGL